MPNIVSVEIIATKILEIRGKKVMLDRDLAKLYGISDTTISLGLSELEEKGIVEISRDKPVAPDFSDRKANVYRMMGLTPREGKGE